MAVLHLTVPYADTSAGMLGYALGLPVQAALGDLVVAGAAGPDTVLTLRLLGASHQALLDTAGGRISETVAYLDAVEPTLPDRVDRALPGGRYHFTARVRRFSADALRHEVDALRRMLAQRRHALVGVFPGVPDAVTALLAEPRGPRERSERQYNGPTGGMVRWQTWHVYPQTAEVAYTRSTVRVRGSMEKAS